MKFTKEDAYKDLVAKMTSNGEKLNLSERSFNEQLEQLMPLIATEETELSDFIEKCLPFFNTANANVRNDISVGINEYKKNNPPKTTVVTDPNVDGTWKERFEQMEKKIADAEAKERVSNVKKQLLAKMQEKGVKNKEWAEALISEVTITDDFDVDSKAESYLAIYNKMQSTVRSTRSPEGAGGGSGETYVNDVIKRAGELEKRQFGK